MTFEQWAEKWNVPIAAVIEYKKMIGLIDTPTIKSIAHSEVASQAELRLRFSQLGGRLWRNNVGACQTTDGRHIRYGLANDSQRVNRSIKSSDLIGITPVLITDMHVGLTLGQFTAIEVKRSDWTYSGTERELAQRKFIELVKSLGGEGYFYS
jgi:hypothetical protein